MSTSVLVPVDGSPLSMRALRHACRAFPDAELTAYHVVDLFDPDAPAVVGGGAAFEPMPGTDEWYGSVRDATEDLFERVETVAGDYDRSIATESDIGDPKRLVVDYATEEDVDHVVVGAHGRSAASRSIYGTVAETLVRRAPVPVTVVR